MELLGGEDDFFTSIIKALEEIDPKWKRYKGIIIPGSHSIEDIDLKLKKIKFARENNIPFLGICFGMQLALVEFARNVLKIDDANSEEIDDKTNNQIFKKMPKLRVGIYNVSWPEWGNNLESHWHNYAFNEDYHGKFRDYFEMSYFDKDNILEIVKLKNHPFFYGIQFHPEYQSRKDNPHPLLKRFIKICKQNFVADGPQH